MANAILLATALALLVLQGLVAYVSPADWLSPVLILPAVLYVAVGEFSLPRGVSLAFVMGYLADVFGGASMGLWTFTLVSIFLLVRVAGLKLFLHGVVFQVLLTLVAGVFAGVEMMALLLVFDRRPLSVLGALAIVTGQACVTAALAPAIFALLARLPGGDAGVQPEESA